MGNYNPNHGTRLCWGHEFDIVKSGRRRGTILVFCVLECVGAGNIGFFSTTLPKDAKLVGATILITVRGSVGARV